MPKALLDTDIVIDILRGDGDAGIWLDSVKSLPLGISAIVWMEIIRGASNKTHLQQLGSMLEQYHVLPITEADTYWAMEQLANFRLSHGIDYADCLIAALAVRARLPFYTRNIKHYAPLPDLDAQRPY